MKNFNSKAINKFTIALFAFGICTFTMVPNSLFTNQSINTVHAAGVSQTPNLSSTSYNSANIFTQSGYKGQCTWFVWGRTLEKLNMKLPSQFYGNATTWWDKNVKDNKFKYGSEPRENSIAVWGGGSGGYGHVAFVESVNGSTVNFNEANISKSKNYDGALESLTTTQMKQRGTLQLKGYIYLTSSAPSTGTYANRAITIKGGPSDSYASIGSVSNQEAVTILSKEGSWYQIEYNTTSGKKRGYALADYITTTVSASAADFSKTSKSGYATKALNVMGGPADNYVSIGSVENKEAVTVLTQEGSWCFIEYNTASGKKRGYVRSSYIDTTVKVTSVNLNKSSSTLFIGGSDTLTASVLPENATNKTVSWSSSDPKVATVTNGQVKALAEGTAVITVTTVDGKKLATYTVKVNKAATTLKLTAPQSNLYKTASFSSPLTYSNMKQATLAPQTVTVVEKNGDWYCIKTSIGNAWINIKNPLGVVNVTGISLNKVSATLIIGESDNLTASILPSDATNKAVTWSSSDLKIATVNNGQVKALTEGTAVITVTTVDGKKLATYTVKVNKAATTLKLTAPQSNLYKTASFTSPLTFANGVQAALGPQTVTLVQQNGDWYCVKTSLGDAWLNIKTPIPPLTLTAVQTNLYKTNSFNTPLTFPNGVQATLAPQAVTVVQQNGDWYCVKTSLGDAWLNIKTPIPPLVLTAPRTNLYKTASFDTPLSGSLSPQTVTVVKQDGDWYCIKTWLGDNWINLKNPTGVITGPINGTGDIVQDLNAQIGLAKGAIAYNANHRNYMVEQGYGGQCTAYVWGRILQKFNEKLSNSNAHFVGSAQSWWDDNLGMKEYATGNIPKENSIVVWSGGSNGHVAFVEKVIGEGDTAVVYFSEANVSTYKDGKLGGGYEGTVKVLTAAQMRTRMTGKVLKGYIYFVPESPIQSGPTGQASAQGVQFICSYESYKQYAYTGQDSGNLTIGYGHVILPGESFPNGISEPKAKELLVGELKTKYSKTLDKFIGTNKITLNQNQYDALVSFTYNVGENVWSTDFTLKKLLLSGNKEAAAITDAMTRWVYVTDKNSKTFKSGGLWRRRMDEAEMFNTGDYTRQDRKIPSDYL